MNTAIFTMMIVGVIVLLFLPWRRRTVCFFKGHRRGKFVREADINGDLYKLYQCRRCQRETRYKVRANVHAMPTNGGTPGDEEPHKPGFGGDEDEDHRLDDPRRGQAAGLNRENRGRE